NVSQVCTGQYYIDDSAPVIEASPEAGNYQAGQSVTLIANDASPTMLYYTTDGTEPTTSSTRYQFTAPFGINYDTTLKVLAVDAAGNNTVKTIDYHIQLPVTVYDPQQGPSASARVAVMQYDQSAYAYVQVAAGVTDSDGIYYLPTSALNPGLSYLMVASSMSGSFLYYKQFNNSNITGITIDATNANKISVSSLIGESPLTGTLYASLYFYEGESETKTIAYSYPLTYMSNGQSEVWLDPGYYFFQVSSSDSAKYVRDRVSVYSDTTELQIQAQEMLPVTMAVYGNYTQSWLSPRNNETWATPNLPNTNNGLFYLSPGEYSLYSWLDNGKGLYVIGPYPKYLQTDGSLNWQVGGDLSGCLSFGNETSSIQGNKVLFRPGVSDAFGNEVTDILGSDLQRKDVTITIAIKDSGGDLKTILTDHGPWINFSELGQTLEWNIPQGLTSGDYTATVTVDAQTAGTFSGELTFYVGVLNT
ncbi:MAG: chitobiase/beta-hexosaminidase C-terminal domain-containing protein, partial [Bacillota bacterium]